MSPDQWFTIGMVLATAALNGYVALRVVQVELRGLRGRIGAIEKRVDRLEGPHFNDRRPA